MAALDDDSAGILAYTKDWKIIDDSYTFSNAICLIVLMNTGKLVNFFLNVFCFFRIWFWIGQHDPIRTKLDKFFNYVFLKETCCVWVFFPRTWNVLLMRFSRKNLKHKFEKMERWPRDNQKVIFLFYFLVENEISPNIWGFSLNNNLLYNKHLILKLRWYI